MMNHEKLSSRKGFTLSELIVVLAILTILSIILIPIIGGYVSRANEQADIASARLLFTSTIIGIGSDNLGTGTYKAVEPYGESNETTAPAPYHEMLGLQWPQSRINGAHFEVIVDYSQDINQIITVYRISSTSTEAYNATKAIFE